MKQAAAFPVLAAVSSMSFCVAVGCELFLQGGIRHDRRKRSRVQEVVSHGERNFEIGSFGRVTVHINVDVHGSRVKEGLSSMLGF